MQLSKKTLLIAAIVALAAGLIIAKRLNSKPAAPSPQAIAACQKQVKSTYTNLTDTSSLVAPQIDPGIQKQEDDALAACNN